MHDASLEPLGAGLVAGVGGSDVLADLLDDGQQLGVLAGVEAWPRPWHHHGAGRHRHRGAGARGLGQRGAGGQRLGVQAAQVIIQLLGVVILCLPVSVEHVPVSPKDVIINITIITSP